MEDLKKLMMLNLKSLMAVSIFIISSCTNDKVIVKQPTEKNDISVNNTQYSDKYDDSIKIDLGTKYSCSKETFLSFFETAQEYRNYLNECNKLNKDTIWFDSLSINRRTLYKSINSINKSYAIQCDKFSMLRLESIEQVIFMNNLIKDYTLFFVVNNKKQTNGFYVLNVKSGIIYFVNCHHYIDYSNVWTDYKNIASVSIVNSDYSAKSTLYFYFGVLYKRESSVDDKKKFYVNIMNSNFLKKNKEIVIPFELTDSLKWSEIEQMFKYTGIPNGEVTYNSLKTIDTSNW